MVSVPLPGLSSLRAWTYWSRILLIAQAAVAVVALLTALQTGRSQPEAGDLTTYSLLSLVQLLVFVVAGIVVLCWTYKAAANLSVLGAQDLTYSPALAVGSYFIPIANLGMPLSAMREIWKASADPRDWQTVKLPATAGWWWFFWISGGIADIVATRLYSEQRYSDLSGVADRLWVFSDAATVAASLLLAMIISRIAALQDVAAT